MNIMHHLHVRRVIALCFLLHIGLSGKDYYAQATALSQGDLSFVGFSGVVTTPKLAFVTWVQIDSGTTIKFTDNTFNSNTSNSNANGNANTTASGVMYWTATSTVAAGTVVTISGTTSTPTANTGTASMPSSTSNGGNGFWSMGNGGRTIWAYQYGTTGNTNDFSATGSATATYNGTMGSLICAIVVSGAGLNSYFISSGSSTSKISYAPADFDTTYSVTGLSTSGANVRSAYYNGPSSGFATFAAARAAVNTHDGTNWGTYLGPADNTIPTYVNMFTLSGASKVSAISQNNPSVMIYPNPAKDEIHIKTPVKAYAHVLSLDGRILIRQQNTDAIDIHELAIGTYIVQVFDADNRLLKTDRFVKEQ